MTTETMSKPGEALRANQLGFRAQLPFHYCAYWGTWSRVLLINHRGNSTVELNLTPINPNMGSRQWKHILDAVVRVHCTPLGEKDKELRELPAYVRELMVTQIGEDVTAKLIDWDWVSLIDPVKLRQYKDRSPRSGGGCPVNLLLKDGLRWAH